MEESAWAQSPLFTAPLGGFVAHLTWRPGEGWRVHVNSWPEGQAPLAACADTYTYLTADEALDVLAASVMSRCEWLHP